jgi:hypothetical protein
MAKKWNPKIEKREPLLGLPAPRLQFRWEPIAEPVDGFNWMCHYEFVMALKEGDIRRTNDKKSEMVIPLGGTRVGRDKAPIYPDGTIDTPFRDGVHAGWDAAQLGSPPIFAVWETNVFNVSEYRAKRDAATA